MDLIRYCALLSVACASAPTTVKERATALTTTGCIDPAALGAIPGDGISDRVPIQAAIDAAQTQPDGGTVCLGGGRWTLDRAPVGSYNRFAALSTHSPRPLVIRGAGPETVLELPGDQGNETSIVIAIDPGAQHLLVTSLTIDTSAATNTSEQTHAIGTTGVCDGATCLPIRDIKIENIRFLHPRNTTSRKGDCIRLLGNDAATAVYDVRIVGNHFEDCARSAIEFQRELHGVVVSGNTIHCESCDQQIDGEATGGGWDFGILVTGNVITSGPAVQGDYAIACTSCEGAVFANNRLDRGIALYRTKDVVITGNTIATVSAHADDGGTIRVRNVCDGVIVSNNAVRRTGAAGPLISLEAQVSSCLGASVTGNNLTQGTPRFAIYAEALSRGSISGNVISHTVPAPAYSAIYVRSTMVDYPITALAIGSNSIYGAVTYAITLEGYPGQFGAGISLTGNVADGPTTGLRCTEPTQFKSPITSTGNTWGPTSYSGVTVNAGN